MKMKKNSQKIILLFLILVLVFAPGVFAQDEEALVCHEPISIGSSLDATLEAMEVLFIESQNIHREVANQIDAANTALAAIGKDAANCNTSTEVCKAMCPEISPDIMVEATLLWFIKLARWHICIPACSSASCLGKPCPSLAEQVGLIGDSLSSTTISIQKINDVFTSSTEQIEEDIIKEGEVAEVNDCLSWNRFDEKECLLKLGISEAAIHHYQWDCKPIQAQKKWDCRLILYSGLKINKIELAQRKLERTRADFHRWRMSPDDWEKVYRGEITPRTAMKCLVALEERSYWPKWWTEDCEEYCKTDPYSRKCQDCLCSECESTFSPMPTAKYCDDHKCCTDVWPVDADAKVCQECLDQNPIHQYSWTKATGCKFYGACKEECKDLSTVELLEGCLTCLCAGLPAADECVQQHGGEDACDDECEKECKAVACQKWICGRSMLNWTSCLSY